MNIFDELFSAATTQDELKKFVDGNIESIYALYVSSYKDVANARISIERFVLLKRNILAQLDYTDNNTKSFLLILLDLCERLNSQSAMTHIYRISKEKGLRINARIKAGISFIYPQPKDANDLIGRFDSICQLLQTAIENEEDNEKKALTTFLNYYSAIVTSLHPSYIKEFRSKIEACISNNKYPFLSHIPNLSSISDDEYADSIIQGIIDSINAKDARKSVPEENVFLIEKNTAYSQMLSRIGCSFDKIRNIALNNAGTNRLSGRGVEIIQSEQDLYTYLKSYGNMHKAKFVSALLPPFPQHLQSKMNIIDWGCGQGLATILFIEKYGVDSIESITLVEPSKIAISRAALHCQCMAPKVKIVTINKKLDDLHSTDIPLTPNTINLFSNILDIDDYSSNHLISIVDNIKFGETYYVCVSPYIDDIKTNKIERFVNHFKTSYKSFCFIHTETNTKLGKFWMCNNTYKNGKINHGLYENCLEYDKNNGCLNKWTRILRVFKT